MSHNKQPAFPLVCHLVFGKRYWIYVIFQQISPMVLCLLITRKNCLSLICSNLDLIFCFKNLFPSRKKLLEKAECCCCLPSLALSVIMWHPGKMENNQVYQQSVMQNIFYAISGNVNNVSFWKSLLYGLIDFLQQCYLL